MTHLIPMKEKLKRVLDLVKIGPDQTHYFYSGLYWLFMNPFSKVNYVAILIVGSLSLTLGTIIYLILDDAFWTFFSMIIVCFLLIPFTAFHGIARAGLPVPIGRLVTMCKDDRSTAHSIPTLHDKEIVSQDQNFQAQRKPFITVLRTITGILFGSSMMSPWLLGSPEDGTGWILTMPAESGFIPYAILFSLTAVAFILLWIAENES